MNAKTELTNSPRGGEGTVGTMGGPARTPACAGRARSHGRGRRALIFVALTAAALQAAPGLSAEGPAAPVDALAAANGPRGLPQGVIQLVDQGRITGSLQPSAEPDRLRWQSPAFTGPFEFGLRTVAEVQFPVPDVRPQAPLRHFCVELVGGDQVFGELTGVTDEYLEVASARFGALRLRRDQVLRWYRRDRGGEVVYSGPDGIAGWRQEPEDAWRADGGQLSTSLPAAYLQRDVGLPPQALIEFELSWKGAPDFVFALGVSDDDRELTYKRSYRFEVWDGELVVRCELGREADVDSVDAVSAAGGKAHYLVYLDQIQGRMIVCTPHGGPRAELHIAPRKPQAHSGVRLTNKRGELRLERLRVSHWDGVAPHATDPGRPRVQLQDGRIVYGQVVAFRAAARQLVVKERDDETTLDAEQVQGVFQSPPADNRPRSFRVVYQDGARLSGQLLGISDQGIRLAHCACAEPLSLPLAELQAFLVLDRDLSAPPPPEGVRSGRLEVDDWRLFGHLVDARAAGDATCLAWRPDGSSLASPLRRGVSARIVYRDPPPPPKPNLTAQRQQAAMAGANALRVRILTANLNPPQARTDRGEFVPALHLRSGDRIPCAVLGINEAGVTLKTPFSDSAFIPHAQIQALDFAPTDGSRLDDVRRERLLTLPRLQKDSPPTHLIGSRTGDVLRARVVRLDESLLQAEVRLENRDIPRSRIAYIIWLHPEETAGEPPDAAPPPPDVVGGTRVQALRSDGNRLTFFGQELSGLTLSGTSDVLGPCQVSLEQVDQLFIGRAIDSAIATLAHQQWKLRAAIEPRIAQNPGGAADGGLSGTQSPLVGKPAPEFTLDLLAGGRFRLDEQRGRVVILDFWASWCGPCLQTLPIVEKVAAEFRDQQVRLIAVNLEEPAAVIQGALTRHKLPLTVALDRDGAVAAKYEAQAIPQTVVIDREGKVARLYVGGGPQLEDELRAVLRELVAPLP